MKPILRTVNGAFEIWLNGYVVQNEDKEFYEWYGYDAVCPNDIIEALNSLGNKLVTVKIDGYGGSIWAGSTIYTEFMNYPGKIDFIITGLAASALSTIPMASAKEGNTCKISPMAMMMMHNVQGGRHGDYRDMEHESEILKAANETAVNAYHLKSGLPEDEIRRLMNSEKWLHAKEALELGFVDGILYSDDFPESEQPPEAVINAVRRSYRTMYNSLCVNNCKALEQIRRSRDSEPQNPPAPTPDNPDNSVSQAYALLEIEKQRFGG